MTTIGDVLMALGALAGLGFGAWCLVLLVNLLLPELAARSAAGFEHKPGRQFGWGFAAGLPLVLVGLVMLNVPSPLVKVLGITVWLAMLAIASLGFAGLARLTSKKVAAFGGSTNTFQALGKGTFILVGTCLFPLLGWFVFAPLGLLTCFGCGLTTLRRPSAPPVPAAQVN